MTSTHAQNLAPCLICPNCRYNLRALNFIAHCPQCEVTMQNTTIVHSLDLTIGIQNARILFPAHMFAIIIASLLLLAQSHAQANTLAQLAAQTLTPLSIFIFTFLSLVTIPAFSPLFSPAPTPDSPPRSHTTARAITFACTALTLTAALALTTRFYLSPDLFPNWFFPLALTVILLTLFLFLGSLAILTTPPPPRNR
jgi:hypothetical protein